MEKVHPSSTYLWGASLHHVFRCVNLRVILIILFTYLIIFVLGIDKDIVTPNVADAFKLALMMGDVRLAEEKEGVAGDVYVLDASAATPTHFAKFTPTLVKKFLVCVQVSNNNI